MLFLQTALPCEARPLISHFGLQGLPAGAPLREWGNGEITLFLSGSGPYAACAATSLALGRGERSPGDLPPYATSPRGGPCIRTRSWSLACRRPPC